MNDTVTTAADTIQAAYSPDFTNAYIVFAVLGLIIVFSLIWLVKSLKPKTCNYISIAYWKPNYIGASGLIKVYEYTFNNEQEAKERIISVEQQYKDRFDGITVIHRKGKVLLMHAYAWGGVQVQAEGGSVRLGFADLVLKAAAERDKACDTPIYVSSAYSDLSDFLTEEELQTVSNSHAEILHNCLERGKKPFSIDVKIKVE